MDRKTTVVLDQTLVERAQQLTGIKTKREVIHEALRTLVKLYEQAQIRELRGKLHWDNNLDSPRKARG